MYGLLGDFTGKVIVDGSLFVYARVKVYREIGGIPKTEVILIRNENVANVYNLPVYIWNGEVVSLWNGV